LEEVASEALAFLLAQYSAVIGSVLYLARPPVRVRQGDSSESLVDHLDRWETRIERKVSGGPWVIPQGGEAALAVRPVASGQHVAIHSLLLDEQSVTGSISLIFSLRRVPSGPDRQVLVSSLKSLGNAITLVAEHALLRERLSQLNLFYQVAQSMASTLDLDKVLDNTMQLATAVLDANASALLLVDEANQELVFEYVYGELGKRLQNQRTGLDEGIAGWVVTHGEPVLVNEADQDPRFHPLVDSRSGFQTQSMVCVPIQSRGKVLGALEALNKRTGQGFDEEDLALMVTTANQAAIAIENARLYQSLRDERDRILQAQEDVRRQVARNLHDGTVQFLSAISMGIDHLERLLDLKPEAARSELDALRDLTRQATQQARLALFELRPLILETQGLVPALEAYVQQLQGSEPFGIHLEATDNFPGMEDSIAATIFAIVQEAVNNSKKHASARDVWLRLSTENGWIQIVIEDNGKGFDAEAVDRDYDRRGSIGLLSMRERAELIEGHLSIESRHKPPNTGTRVILRVPNASAVA
jgi:signal transduction histidine kinase